MNVYSNASEKSDYFKYYRGFLKMRLEFVVSLWISLQRNLFHVILVISLRKIFVHKIATILRRKT